MLYIASVDRADVLQMLKRHGWNATSFQVLEPAFRYWQDSQGDACVAYVETRGCWVAAGAPLVEQGRVADAAARFVAAARERGKRACFFAVERRFAELTGFETLVVGEQPVWDPTTWEAGLRGKKSLREQLRRARAKGVAVRPVPAAEIDDVRSPTRLAVEALVAAWLHAKPMAPMGFLVDLEPFANAAERRYFVAEKDGAVVGVLVAVPVYARRGWFFEDLLRDPHAPNGTAEALVDAGMRAAAEEGSAYVTLGLAPLTGDVAPWLRVARAAGALLYDFRGVHAFKAKLAPTSWDPVYLAYPAGANGTVALLDALAAFARGSFTRFGIDTLLRGPAFVVRALALLLLPWTAILAFADAAKWFPAPWVKLAWIAFDVALAAGMLALTQRWRRGLAVALTLAILADAALTLVQAVAYDVPHTRGLLERSIILIACAAPAFAAVVMAGALGHRRAPRA
jgi:phosphatidylglycerol lysyltransferase